jgi:hypothetical protein
MYVRQRESCAKFKGGPQLTAPLGETTSPFEMTSIDICGPYPETKKGNRYLLTFTDHFSWYPEAIPIPRQDAPTIAQALVMTADLQHCKKGPVTICEATFPFIHKNQATCTSALYFGQTDFAHKFCRKLILTGKFNPVWIQAKGSHPFWIYSLPSSIIVTKTCKMNDTTHSSNMELSHTGIVKEDINCQFYSETFICCRYRMDIQMCHSAVVRCYPHTFPS